MRKEVREKCRYSGNRDAGIRDQRANQARFIRSQVRSHFIRSQAGEHTLIKPCCPCFLGLSGEKRKERRKGESARYLVHRADVSVFSLPLPPLLSPPSLFLSLSKQWRSFARSHASISNRAPLFIRDSSRASLLINASREFRRGSTRACLINSSRKIGDNAAAFRETTAIG